MGLRGRAAAAFKRWAVPAGRTAPALAILVAATVSTGPASGGAAGQNVLSVDSVSGRVGSRVTVSLSLANQDVVKGAQVDIRFDPAVVRYVSGATALRAGTMFFTAAVVGTSKVRAILYYSDAGTLPAGAGPVATLSFELNGALGSSTALTPEGAVLSDPQSGALNVTTQAGAVDITDLSVAVLKNPGRTRTLQIFVGADSGLGGAPQVTAGGANVLMGELAGLDLYLGTAFVPEGTSSVEVIARGPGAGSHGTSRTRVGF